MDDDRPVEAWHLDRKVTIYKDVGPAHLGLRHRRCYVRGTADDGKVQAAFDWLYDAERRGPDLPQS